jgi:hypothetical protein
LHPLHACDLDFLLQDALDSLDQVPIIQYFNRNSIVLAQGGDYRIQLEMLWTASTDRGSFEANKGLTYRSRQIKASRIRKPPARSTIKGEKDVDL